MRFIHPNETVHVVVAAYPHGVYSGRMTYISDVLDQATRTMRIRVTVPNPDRALKPEMFAMVRIDAAPQPDALAVPLAAVQQDGGGKCCSCGSLSAALNSGECVWGMSKTGNVIVLEGLREGEDVVVKGALRSGPNSTSIKSSLLNDRDAAGILPAPTDSDSWQRPASAPPPVCSRSSRFPSMPIPMSPTCRCRC